MNNNLLNIDGLEKSFKGNKAVQGISFSVNKGEILCILGPNGAGKSTTINILTGALSWDAGLVSHCDESIHKDLQGYKRQLGIVPQDLAIYEDLNAEQNVQFFASLYGLKGSELKQRCSDALEFVGLLDKAKDKVNTFSGGMKRRLNIACAIAHKPELLIMDEPTVGIDPQSRNHILASIKRLRDDGMTIIYTTHYMEEVEEISTRIIIMDKGKIITAGTKEELKESTEAEKLLYIEVDGMNNLDIDVFYRIEGVKHISTLNGRLEISCLKSIENLDRIIAVLIQHDIKIHSISNQVTSLETVFLQLTGKSLRD